MRTDHVPKRVNVFVARRLRMAHGAEARVHVRPFRRRLAEGQARRQLMHQQPFGRDPAKAVRARLERVGLDQRGPLAAHEHDVAVAPKRPRHLAPLFRDAAQPQRGAESGERGVPALLVVQLRAQEPQALERLDAVLFDRRAIEMVQHRRQRRTHAGFGPVRRGQVQLHHPDARSHALLVRRAQHHAGKVPALDGVLDARLHAQHVRVLRNVRVHVRNHQIARTEQAAHAADDFGKVHLGLVPGPECAQLQPCKHVGQLHQRRLRHGLEHQMRYAELRVLHRAHDRPREHKGAPRWRRLTRDLAHLRADLQAHHVERVPERLRHEQRHRPRRPRLR
eukprot:Unigene8154_Nuclearia_a/m.25013 Unigene8154_Nuclearia_a/g.25013  ORF Unigene8154_Nuclearia_a/g.25013 Unigene8154_Nuclearia_a/m.25013 type:complete len:336 (-) Unigene8154_Nuclearia_a:371-1378(-)